MINIRFCILSYYDTLESLSFQGKKFKKILEDTMKLYENKIVIKIEYYNFVEKNIVSYLNYLIPILIDIENMGYKIILVFSKNNLFLEQRIKDINYDNKIFQKISLNIINQNKLIHFYNEAFSHYCKSIGYFILGSKKLYNKEIQKNLIETIGFLLEKDSIIMIIKDVFSNFEDINFDKDYDNFSFSIINLLKAKNFIILHNYNKIHKKENIYKRDKLINSLKTLGIKSHILNKKNIYNLIEIIKTF